MEDKKIFVRTTLNNLGHGKVARACGLDHRQTVRHWAVNGMLPDTEYLPKDHIRRTNYAEKIARLAKCKKGDLL